MSRARNVSPLFILVALVVAVAALYFAKEILLPFALAVLLCFLLTPVANRLESWRLGRIPSVLVVVAMTFGILGCIGWVVTSQLVQLSYELPDYKDNVVRKIRTVMQSSGSLTKVTSALEEMSQEISSGERESQGKDKSGKSGTPAQTAQQVSRAAAEHWLPLLQVTPRATATKKAVEVAVVSLPPSPLNQVQSWLGPIVAPLSAAGMTVVLLIFLMIDREDQRNRLLQLFGSDNLYATTEAFGDAAKRVSRYLRMQFLINLGYGICVAIGLWLIGVPSAAMWGVLGFSLRFLPYIGPWIAAALPILVSLAVSEGWVQPLWVIGLYLLLELVLNNVAEPWLYGGSVGISSVGVIISAIFWTWLWGPIGLILAMPLTVCLLVMARYVPQLRFISTLLADRPAMSLAERVYQRMLAGDESELDRLMRKQLAEQPLSTVYDTILIPALTLAEEDRHADLLNDDQSCFVEEIADDLVRDLGEANREKAADVEADDATSTEGSVIVGRRVFCIPLRDRADETSAQMLAQLLQQEGMSVDVASTDSLASEVVEQVEKQQPDVVVISILPPVAPRETRLLWKRLRARFPHLPVVVGCWDKGNDMRPLLGRFEQDGPSSLVASLVDAVHAVKAAAQSLPRTAG